MMRLRSGSSNLHRICRFLQCFVIFKSVVHVYGLEPDGRPTSSRRLIRLQTIFNVIKYHKTFEKNRYDSGSIPIMFSIHENSVLYMYKVTCNALTVDTLFAHVQYT